MFHDFVISIRLEYVPSSAPFGAPSPQGEGKGRSRASAVNNHLYAHMGVQGNFGTISC